MLRGEQLKSGERYPSTPKTAGKDGIYRQPNKDSPGVIPTSHFRLPRSNPSSVGSSYKGTNIPLIEPLRQPHNSREPFQGMTVQHHQDPSTKYERSSRRTRTRMAETGSDSPTLAPLHFKPQSSSSSQHHHSHETGEKSQRAGRHLHDLETRVSQLEHQNKMLLAAVLSGSGYGSRTSPRRMENSSSTAGPITNAKLPKPRPPLFHGRTSKRSISAKDFPIPNSDRRECAGAGAGAPKLKRIRRSSNSSISSESLKQLGYLMLDLDIS